mmetsp:Transcript_17292/g.35243  ORF Transcript_17292/g.35243 Transcript_17292/m.35243 type:complete len:236 (-) Transcript_17292:362-1069(-)
MAICEHDDGNDRSWSWDWRWGRERFWFASFRASLPNGFSPATRSRSSPWRQTPAPASCCFLFFNQRRCYHPCHCYRLCHCYHPCHRPCHRYRRRHCCCFCCRAFLFVFRCRSSGWGCATATGSTSSPVDSVGREDSGDHNDDGGNGRIQSNSRIRIFPTGKWIPSPRFFDIHCGPYSAATTRASEMGQWRWAYVGGSDDRRGTAPHDTAAPSGSGSRWERRSWRGLGQSERRWVE